MFKLKPSKHHSPAFTTMELIVTVAVLLILFIIFLYFGPFKQIHKGYDAARKKDLEKLSVAFEDYYNDHYCYPTQDMINNCGSDDLAPYLDSVPCDPVLDVPYQLVTSSDSCPQNYLIYALLEDENAPGVNEYSCYSVYSPNNEFDLDSDCSEYYASITPSTTPATSGTPTGTDTPTPVVRYYYCSDSAEGGNCTALPAGKTCDPVYADDPWCNNECADPANTCIPH